VNRGFEDHRLFGFFVCRCLSCSWHNRGRKSSRHI